MLQLFTFQKKFGMSDCIEKRRNGEKEKTKTKSLIPDLENEEYTRQPHSVLKENNKLIAGHTSWDALVRLGNTKPSHRRLIYEQPCIFLH